MKMSYYPGCSLAGTSAEYDRSIREVAGLLGFELVELTDWNCCGASSGHMTDHRLSIALSSRNLSKAVKLGLDLLVPCSACFQRLRVADKLQSKDTSDIRAEEAEAGDFAIIHLTRFVARPDMLARVKALVRRPLHALDLACYYGCLSLRPPAVTGAPDCENPDGLDRIVTALGARAVRWSHKTECCSSSLSMSRPDIAARLVGDIVGAARRAGARALVTDCPMCQANLEARQSDRSDGLPVFFITELVAYAMSEDHEPGRWRQHLIDPKPLLGGIQSRPEG